MKRLFKRISLMLILTLAIIPFNTKVNAEEVVPQIGDLGLGGVVDSDGKVIIEAGSLQNPGDVKVTKIVEKTNELGKYSVTFKIQGLHTTSSTSVTKPVYAVIVFDQSGSMENKAQNKWNNAVKGAKTFATGLLEKVSTAKIALVGFSGTKGDETCLEGHEETSLFGNKHFICDKYDESTLYNDAHVIREFENDDLDDADFGSPDGGTNLGEGLRKAKELLDTVTGNVTKLVVVIGDGEPTYYTIAAPNANAGITAGDGGNMSNSTKEYATSNATALKNAGVEIFSIGYSVNANSDAEKVLKSISSSNKHYISSKPDDVVKAFNEVVEQIPVITNAGSEGSLNDGIGTDFTLVVNGSNVIEIGDITDEEITTTPFFIEIDKNTTTGWHDTNASFTLTYKDKDGKTQTVSSDVNPQAYWVRPSYAYRVEYYYDGVQDTAATVNGSIAYASVVSTYPNKDKTGYKFDTVTGTPLTISDNPDNNVIKVYYVKDSFAYCVDYYYNTVKDESATVNSTALFGNVIDSYTDKPKTGFKFDTVIGKPLTISAVPANNVISVYYVSDTFGYSVEYYYDGIKDESATVNASALFGSTVTTYTDKPKTGYKFDKTEGKPLTISADPTNNVIKVYYVKDNFSYSVEYYYDGIKDESATVNSTALFGNVIDSYSDKPKTGYKFDKTEGKPLTISADPTNNVIKVYYVKDVFDYTVEHYLENLDGEYELTDTVMHEDVLFGSDALFTINEYTNYEYDEDKTENAGEKVPAHNRLVIRLYYNLKEGSAVIKHFVNVDGTLIPLKDYAYDADHNLKSEFAGIILEDDIITGKIGSSFTTAPRIITDYTLEGLYETSVAIENRLSGDTITSAISEEESVFIYVYEPPIEELPPQTGVENNSIIYILLLVILYISKCYYTLKNN